MSDADAMPRAARPFLAFVALLRANGFAIAPEQTTAFLAAIALLGPRDPEDIRQAGLATLAPALGERPSDEETVRVQDDRRGEDEPREATQSHRDGRSATRAEALVQRRFGPTARPKPCAGSDARPGRRLPRRRSYRRDARAARRRSSTCAGPCATPRATTAK